MSKKHPPRRMLNLLQFFCKEYYLEQIEGDLYELFDREPSAKKARRLFSWYALGFFRPRYLKGVDDYEQLTPIAMIKNYLKIAIRTLLKQKSYAGINIAGLAVGLASCLLIVMYIAHERSYDDFYPEVDKMYRVAVGERGRFTPAMLASTMMKEYPQVEAATKITGLNEAHIQMGDQIFVQPGGCWADENVFRVFQMKFLSGDPESALKEPDNMVLTASLAKKYFPDQPATGLTLKVDGDVYKITGVVEDPPKNTHFPFTFIVSDPLDPKAEYNWTGNNHWTYAIIQEGVSVAEMNGKLQELYAKYTGPEIIRFSGHASFEEFLKEYSNRYFGYTVHPVRDIHLHQSHFSMGARGDYQNVIVFSLVALFILLIACINYINMATARSSVRSKEVGIRKALGSQRRNIVVQFLTESVLITFLAVILALVLSFTSLEYFNQLTGRLFSIGDLFTPTSVLAMIGLLMIVGLLAGFYPAYIISGFSPLKALRGQFQQAGKRSLRSILVSFQFAISVFLVAATYTIYNQVTFMQSQELGVNIDQTLVIRNGSELGDKYNLFKEQLLLESGVQKVAVANSIPFHGYGDWTYQLPEEDNHRTAPMNAFVEPGIEEVLDLEIVEGRFLDTRATDTASVVINQALARELGWENPLGKKLARQIHFTVVGVMKDFNYTSLKRDIRPMIFRYGNKDSEVGMWYQQYVLAKINSQDIIQTLNNIEDKWDEMVPEYPFDAYFMDEAFQRQYEGERKFGQVFTTFSLLAIFIAFLGLFALTTFVLQKRFKEIAVRKVLGASVPSLLKMMVKDFSRLVLIGGTVGIAGAYYWLDSWLQDYSYRIELSWYLLVIPVALILVLTWLVVCMKSYKAALANPSNALKEE